MGLGIQIAPPFFRYHIEGCAEGEGKGALLFSRIMGGSGLPKGTALYHLALQPAVLALFFLAVVVPVGRMAR